MSAITNLTENAATTGPTTPPPPAAHAFFVLLMVASHEGLVAREAELQSDADGEVTVSNQLLDVFEEARTRTKLVPRHWARYGPGSGYFVTDSAEDAEALAAAVIAVAVEQNIWVPDRTLHKRITIGIVDIPLTSAVWDSQALLNGSTITEAVAIAHPMIGSAPPGELRITDSVYKILAPARQELFRPVANLAPGEVPRWRRSVGNQVPPRLLIASVMEVDMVRYGYIQEDYRQTGGDELLAKLSNEIKDVIRGGFLRANAGTYTQYLYKWGGDGGVFFFKDPDMAHRVGAAILNYAEEMHNKVCRKEKRRDYKYRCFRVGIDLGQLNHDGREYGGAPLTRAERLQTGAPSGELHVSEEFYKALPHDLQRAYGGPELIFGKPSDGTEGISGRRCQVAPAGPWTEVGRDNKPFALICNPNPDFIDPNQGVAKQLESCFVICPLGDDEARTKDVYERLIDPACESAGYAAQRATDVYGNRSVIVEQLTSAPLVVAYLGDPKAWNYNVVLEVGIRLATRLPLVIVSEGLSGGHVPNYQQLLPFQLVHHNVITLPTAGEDPTSRLDALVEEIRATRVAPTDGVWESPNPVVEFSYTTFADAIVTDANETARAVFGSQTLRRGQSIVELRKVLQQRTDAAQFAARLAEQKQILNALMVRAVNGSQDTDAQWQPPKARIPIVFSDGSVDPVTRSPIGYLPIVLRYHFGQQKTTVRYVYLRVCESMRREACNPYYTCDI